jgi:uncharacterized protein (DUF2237 family)
VGFAQLGLNRIRKKGIGSKQREDKATGKAARKMDQLELGDAWRICSRWWQERSAQRWIAEQEQSSARGGREREVPED